MPETVLPAPQADLASLIPSQRSSAPELVEVPAAAEHMPDPAPERLAFLWTMLGAAAGSAIVAVAFLVLLALLP